MTDIGERLARLEGGFQHSVEGLRHSQNMTLTAVIGVGGLLFALGLYVLNRIDNLPDEFLKLNQTLATAITATKQQAPQVIFMPAPTIAPASAPSPAPTPEQPKP